MTSLKPSPLSAVQHRQCSDRTRMTSLAFCCGSVFFPDWVHPSSRVHSLVGFFPTTATTPIPISTLSH